MAAQASCLDLALEGERLCKAGDCQTGVAYFEAAIQVGTEDLKTLSAVYSQLGNAYFFLQEYEKALEFHRHDLTLTRTLADREGEAKASGNLGNTLKVLGKFDEAVVCCMRHLELSKESSNKVCRNILRFSRKILFVIGISLQNNSPQCLFIATGTRRRHSTRIFLQVENSIDRIFFANINLLGNSN
ncbi:G- -signaling modulator 2-like [Paramuricea clavata]|uniref:G- -signaling modulator 2-like n=1 Tax=Paramuricea clavata TaxID=317549 RepID=A0A7D9LYD5_PARCT|nr:G- -signaling modulator 2-like [Paramuricea clavata]